MEHFDNFSGIELMVSNSLTSKEIARPWVQYWVKTSWEQIKVGAVDVSGAKISVNRRGDLKHLKKVLSHYLVLSIQNRFQLQVQFFKEKRRAQFELQLENAFRFS